FVCDSTNQRISIAPRQFQKDLEHSRIRNSTTKDLHVLHLARHDRLLDTLVFEKANHLSELTNANPFNAISESFDRWISFFANRRNRHAGSRLASAFQHHKGKLAIPGNQSELHFVT